MNGAGGVDAGVGEGLFSKRRKGLWHCVEDDLVPVLTDSLVDGGFRRR